MNSYRKFRRFWKFFLILLMLSISVFVSMRVGAYLEHERIIKSQKYYRCTPLFTAPIGFIEDPDSHEKWYAVRVEDAPGCAPCHSLKPPTERVNLSKLQCPARDTKTKKD